VTKKLARDCSGWRITGEVFLTVICGDDSRLCHGDDVPAYRDRRSSIRGLTSFLEVLWSCLDDRRGIGAAGCRGPWDETIEPDWSAMLTPPRTLGFSCSRVELPLLMHPWLLTCSRVIYYPARAHACGIKPSWPPVEHSRSYPRTR
jgi:hypothetical protein